MTEKTIKDSLNDLRDDSKNSNNEVAFGKRFFGGYNRKEVSEHIKALTESLKTAEVSFRERLEEYTAMSAMLEQDRDKYMKMANENEKINQERQHQVNILSTENEALKFKVQGINDETVSPDDHLECESMALENEKLRKELNAYKEYNQDNIDLKEQFDQLKLTVQDLNAQITDYGENETNEKAYNIIFAENDIIKQKYDEVVYENSMSLAEKESLIEQNKRLSQSLIEINEKNKELRNEITISNLKTRKMMVEFEARAYEYSQNHRKNIDEITENIKNTLKVLHYENKDFANLVTSPFGELEIETEAAEDDLESAVLPESELEAISTLTASMEKKLLAKMKDQV
ncbi:MAG: hypothetical protein ACOH15_07830 [Acetobacterium sp.]